MFLSVRVVWMGFTKLTQNIPNKYSNTFLWLYSNSLLLSMKVFALSFFANSLKQMRHVVFLKPLPSARREGVRRFSFFSPSQTERKNKKPLFLHSCLWYSMFVKSEIVVFLCCWKLLFSYFSLFSSLYIMYSSVFLQRNAATPSSVVFGKSEDGLSNLLCCVFTVKPVWGIVMSGHILYFLISGTIK